MEKEDKNQLRGGLSSGQMQMIALGGTIGVGLFLGSATTIAWTGPSVILAYGFMGIILYLVMRALGEILYINPSTGSFADYATNYIHPVVGWLTSWSNIFQYIVVGISEVIAVGTYIDYWFPGVPGWVSGLVVIITLTLANLVSVKTYGRLEYYFAMVKVLTIILLIIMGLLMIIFGLGNHWQPIGFSNLWAHGGFFTGGITGFMFSLSIIAGSYQGIEVLGITAGEAEQPREAIVKSIHSVIYRILIFYIGAIFVIVTLFPWNELGNIGSPFVETFAKVGIAGAASIINFVVLTAAMSGSNSGIYSSSRMLYKLGQDGYVSKKFAKLSSHHVPYVAILAISFGILLGILMNAGLESFSKIGVKLFVVVYSSSVLPGMVPWFVIILSELRFRRSNQHLLTNHPLKMPLYPFSNYFALIALSVILVFMFLNPDTRVSVSIGVGFLLLMTIIYFIQRPKQK
ncbi:amino acid permease [Weissella diestrammenae]|uniref:Amino acid permease n=1 Tax=Weissella diestrammenae TaxID=1162633 RepID=A0A7G9T7F5_9LACO|nr:amino acid permease [Weissella diestrammenae]MCM0582086.1 amino acid permease [Weissella diestrammenae]QNN76030.1 amino acid permease [Weissella diestrammenae]